MRVGPVAQARLRRTISAIEDSMGNAADDLAHPGVCRYLECDLLSAFIGALRGGCHEDGAVRERRLSGRHRRLRRVRDFIAERLDQPLPTEDICSEAGLSARGTENLFRDFLGLTPIAFLRHQRLHGVRRALLFSERVPGAVKKAAIEMGFWHLGYFARDYRRLFGETPSQTLAMGRRV